MMSCLLSPSKRPDRIEYLDHFQDKNIKNSPAIQNCEKSDPASTTPSSNPSDFLLGAMPNQGEITKYSPNHMISTRNKNKNQFASSTSTTNRSKHGSVSWFPRPRPRLLSLARATGSCVPLFVAKSQKGSYGPLVSWVCLTACSRSELCVLCQEETRVRTWEPLVSLLVLNELSWVFVEPLPRSWPCPLHQLGPLRRPLRQSFALGKGVWASPRPG